MNEGDVYELVAIVRINSVNVSYKYTTNTYIHLNSLNFSQVLPPELQEVNSTLLPLDTSCYLHVTLFRIYFDEKTLKHLTLLGTNKSVSSHNASQQNIFKVRVQYAQRDIDRAIYESNVAFINVNVNINTNTTETETSDCTASNVQSQFISYSILTTFYFVLLQYFVLKLMLN